MAILLNPGTYWHSPEAWLDALRAELPEMVIMLWPDVSSPESVELVVASRHDLDDLRRYPNLRFVLAMGAGVEHYTGPEMPDVPVVRLADQSMSTEMAAYVVHWVVHFQRRMDAYLANQSAAVWRPEEYSTADRFPVAVLGFGLIGRRIGQALHELGFPINAWSRRGTEVEWATSFAGAASLEECLGASAAVVNVLPLTPDTHKLMNSSRFDQCRPGALFINLGRGATVDEADLLLALDSGRIGNAVLDVADPEPMDPANPLWSHPRARITPHAAGYTIVESASKVIAANVRRIFTGDEPFPLVDKLVGY